jgi:hypothetical protein
VQLAPSSAKCMYRLGQALLASEYVKTWAALPPCSCRDKQGLAAKCMGDQLTGKLMILCSHAASPPVAEQRA